jgi:hypothetical protein
MLANERTASAWRRVAVDRVDAIGISTPLRIPDLAESAAGSDFHIVILLFMNVKRRYDGDRE